ncbi:MAG TPA: hypothetical protein VKU90_15840 [Caulobacteraceae bacterium]|nr:hypothetical protein [Caulobacteraceae bacterium]
MTGAIVVTGCDANHFELAIDLLTSLRDARGRDVTIGFIHVGDEALPPAIRDAADRVVHVADPDHESRSIRGFRLAYLGVKARLPDYFPGFDTYVWLDGDTWVQNAVGLDHIVNAAGYSDLCVHPERDPNYDWGGGPEHYLKFVYNELYGDVEAERFAGVASFNSGVFGARASSPLWPLWPAELDALRLRWAGADVHFSDQIPMHRLVASHQIAITPLRSVNNWLCFCCLPAVNLQRRKLHAPTYPFEEINIVHLIGDTKDRRFRLGDSEREITLRYRDIRALFAEPADA